MSFSILDTYKLLTQRFELNPFRIKEAKALQGLWNEPEVRRFLWDDETVSLEKTSEILEKNEKMFEEKGYGIWRISRWGNREIAGFIGFWEFHDPPVLELLYGLDPKFWNKGVATEASEEILRYVFEECNFEKVRASTDSPNIKSIKVMERLGMQRIESSESVDAEDLSTVHYVLHREDWKK